MEGEEEVVGKDKTKIEVVDEDEDEDKKNVDKKFRKDEQPIL